MNFNCLSSNQIEDLKTLVPADRFSAGESVLDLHARDESAHAACRPEAVIWPQSAAEVSAILKYADAPPHPGDRLGVGLEPGRQPHPGAAAGSCSTSTG